MRDIKLPAINDYYTYGALPSFDSVLFEDIEKKTSRFPGEKLWNQEMNSLNKNEVWKLAELSKD